MCIATFEIRRMIRSLPRDFERSRRVQPALADAREGGNCGLEPEGEDAGTRRRCDS